MQRYKIISKYLFGDEHLRFLFSTKITLTLNEIENIEKINNRAFLQLSKNYEIKTKENRRIKLLDALLNFPIENYSIINILLSKLKYNFSNFFFIKSFSGLLTKLANLKLFSRKTSHKKDSLYEPSFTDNNGKEILLFKFEMEFIKSKLKENNNLKYVPRGKRVGNYRNITNKKIFEFNNVKNFNDEKTNNNIYRKIKENRLNFYHITNKKLANGKSKPKYNTLKLNSLLRYKNSKFLRKIKKEKNEFYFNKKNLEAQLKFLQKRIRNKEICGVKKKFKKYIKYARIINNINFSNIKYLFNTGFVYSKKQVKSSIKMLISFKDNFSNFIKEIQEEEIKDNDDDKINK